MATCEKGFIIGPLGGIPVVVDDLVPLTSKDPATGEEVEIAAFEFEGKLLVHPDRWAEFRKTAREVYGARFEENDGDL
jgi:hypothetical protein